MKTLKVNKEEEIVMTVGVIYVATGKQQYIDEACISVVSLKEQIPNLHVTLFSDQTTTANCFDECRSMESSGSGFLDKILGMQQSPYDYTLFLDTDTYICGDFSELFTLLEKYDVGAILAEHRTGKFADFSWDYQHMKDAKDNLVYPIYNSGVILYKKSPVTTKFFTDWFNLTKQRWMDGKILEDQTSFQYALYQSDLKTIVLAPEYNCRFIYPVGVCGTVKILHGRHKDLAAIAQEINRETDPRIFHPRWGLVPSVRVSLLQKIIKNFIKEKLKS
jgi:hypothetical protein